MEKDQIEIVEKIVDLVDQMQLQNAQMVQDFDTIRRDLGEIRKDMAAIRVDTNTMGQQLKQMS